MSCLESANLEDSTIHEEAAADSADLEDSTLQFRRRLFTIYTNHLEDYTLYEYEEAGADSANLEDDTLHEATADSANLEDSTIHKAAVDGDLKTLKILVKNLDDKNPPIGKKLLYQATVSQVTVNKKVDYWV